MSTQSSTGLKPLAPPSAHLPALSAKTDLPDGTSTTRYAFFTCVDDASVSHSGRASDMMAGDLCVIDCSGEVLVNGSEQWTIWPLEQMDYGARDTHGNWNPFVGVVISGSSRQAGLLKDILDLSAGIGQLGVTAREIDEAVGNLLLSVTRELVKETTCASGIDKHHWQIDRARSFIRENLGDSRFGVVDLAALMGFSPRHLSSLFAMAGSTTSQAILEMRLGRSKSLLSEPANNGRQIAEIARMCGFEDQGHFARRFRDRFGISPRQFRDSQIILRQNGNLEDRSAMNG